MLHLLSKGPSTKEKQTAKTKPPRSSCAAAQRGFFLGTDPNSWVEHPKVRVDDMFHVFFGAPARSIAQAHRHTPQTKRYTPDARVPFLAARNNPKRRSKTKWLHRRQPHAGDEIKTI